LIVKNTHFIKQRTIAHMLTTQEKIKSLDILGVESRQYVKEGKCVVLCHGTFDLIHTGHIRHLQEAKKQGDILVVTITADKYVNKGPDRPVFSEIHRAENLSALSCVDFVGIVDAETAEKPISKIQPGIYVKGNEYKNAANDLTGKIIKEKQLVEKFNGKIYFTNDITFSSSSLINEHFGIFPPETKSYLHSFKQNYSSKVIIDMLQTLKNLNVLVVGDAIVDEYHYVEPLGQSGKGDNLSVKFNSQEQFAGGSLAIANHLAGFAKKVTVLTGLGEQESHEDFVRSKLKKNVHPEFFYFQDAPTIVKRRYVNLDLSKLFEVYFYNDKPSLKGIEDKVCFWLVENTAKFDVVIVPDFGNGFISSRMIQKLCSQARFLAVNTQVNSGNRGYHSINQYSRADFVSLNTPELRIATHDRHDSVENLARKIIGPLGAKNLAVTLGKDGAILLNKSRDTIYKTPVLSTKVLDRIGAGDAFLSLAGLCLGAGIDSDIALFVGSSAAALDVQVVCNRESISPVNLYKYINTLLKS
jgi:rfaE bifunctional protein nucleotidyltransferase chain/domain